MPAFIPKFLNNKSEDKWWFDDKINGKEIIFSYKRDMNTLKKHIEWFKTLPLHIEIDNFFITHVFGLPYYKRRDTKEGLVYTLVYDEGNWEHEWENYQVFNVFGHTPSKKIRFTSNDCRIDTGRV